MSLVVPSREGRTCPSLSRLILGEVPGWVGRSSRMEPTAADGEEKFLELNPLAVFGSRVRGGFPVTPLLPQQDKGVSLLIPSPSTALPSPSCSTARAFPSFPAQDISASMEVLKTGRDRKRFSFFPPKSAFPGVEVQLWVALGGQNPERATLCMSGSIISS